VRESVSESGTSTVATAVAVAVGLVLLALVGSVAVAWTDVGVVRRVVGDAARVIAAAGPPDPGCAIELEARLAELAPALERPAVRCARRAGTVSVIVEGMVAIRGTPVMIPVRAIARAVEER
jgi:hypothetical protein